MAHRVLVIDGVAIAAPDTLGLDVAAFDQLSEDALCRAFSDSHVLGDVAQPDVGRLGQAQQNLGVVGEERPSFVFVGAPWALLPRPGSSSASARTSPVTRW